MTSETMRVLLFIMLGVFYILSLFYLRRRKLPLWGYLFWGIFALLIPALGPFALIAFQPGEPAFKTTASRHLQKQVK